jgi:mono/diheme cytochrome c family protein
MKRDAAVLPPALGVALLATPLLLLAQSKPDHDRQAALLGAASYKAHCASCHGAAAKGDGPIADQLRFAPADLTRIARRNRGRFPFDKVARIIDGREAVKGHGGTEMPVWGDVFKSSAEGYDERKVKLRIEALVHYLASIQEPGGR